MGRNGILLLLVTHQDLILFFIIGREMIQHPLNIFSRILKAAMSCFFFLNYFKSFYGGFRKHVHTQPICLGKCFHEAILFIRFVKLLKSKATLQPISSWLPKQNPTAPNNFFQRICKTQFLLPLWAKVPFRRP